MADNFDAEVYDDDEQEDEIRRLELSKKLLKACTDNDTRSARHLLESADIDIDDKYEERGWSALSWAASHGNIELTRALLALGFANLYAPHRREDITTGNILDLNGEEPNIDDDDTKLLRQNPLLWAAFKGHLEVVWLLLDPVHRLSVSSTDYLHNTALHQAAAGGNASVVATILGCDGVDVWAKNARGHLALDLATDGDSREILLKAMNSKACKSLGKEFSYVVFRVRCGRCTGYFCSEAISAPELEYALPSSKLREKPRRLCFECKQIVNQLEVQLIRARSDYLQIVAKEGDGSSSTESDSGMTQEEIDGMKIVDEILLKTETELVCPKKRQSLYALRLKAICMIRLKKVCAVKPCTLVDEYRLTAESISEAVNVARRISKQCDEEAGIRTSSLASTTVNSGKEKNKNGSSSKSGSASVIQPTIPGGQHNQQEENEMDSTSAILSEWCQRAEVVHDRLLVEAALTKSVVKVLGPGFRNLPLERFFSPEMFLTNVWLLYPSASRLDEVFRGLILKQTAELRRMLSPHLSDVSDYTVDGKVAPIHPVSKLCNQPAPGTLGSLRPDDPDPAAAVIAHRPTSPAATAEVVLKPLSIKAVDLHLPLYECPSLDNGRDLLLRAQRVTMTLGLIAEVEEEMLNGGAEAVANSESCKPENLFNLTEEKRNELKLPHWVSDPVVAFPEQVGKLKDLLRRCMAWDVPKTIWGRLQKVVKSLDEQLATIRKLADEGKMKGELRKWKKSKTKA